MEKLNLSTENLATRSDQLFGDFKDINPQLTENVVNLDVEDFARRFWDGEFDNFLRQSAYADFEERIEKGEVEGLSKEELNRNYSECELAFMGLKNMVERVSWTLLTADNECTSFMEVYSSLYIPTLLQEDELYTKVAILGDLADFNLVINALEQREEITSEAHQ